MPRERRAVVVAYFSIFVGVGVWAPYFPLYLSHLGFRGWQIGAVIGVQPLLRWSSALAWGYVADRWRIRYHVLVFTAGAGLLFFVPLLAVRSLAAMSLVLAGIAAFHGTLIPMLDSVVMDHVDTLGGDYGRLRLWGSLGFIAGALLSAPLIHAFSPTIVPALLLLPGIGTVPALLGLPRRQRGNSRGFRAPWRLLNPALRSFLTAAFVLQFSCAAWGGFFALHTASLGFSDAVPGITWALAVSVEVLFLYWGGRVLERIAPAQMILIAIALSALRWGLTAVIRNELVIVVLQLGHVLTFSAFHLGSVLLLARLIPAESTTSGQSLHGMVAYGLGGSAGLGVAGLLVDRIGTSGLFAIEALVALLGVVPAMRLNRLLGHLPKRR